MNRVLITLICFAIVIGGGIFFVMPRYSDYQDLATDINAKEVELQYYQNYSAELREIAARLESYEEEVSKIDDFLPTDFSLPVFYFNIQNMSSQSGMILTSIKEGGLQDKNGIKERFYNLTVVGNYSGFKSFLSVLEKSAKLIEVEKFNLSSDAVEEEGRAFSLEIKTYSQ